MPYPRLITHIFDEASRYTVPFEKAGRLDLIANELYGTPHAWKVLAAANNIKYCIGTRMGINPRVKAYENELKMKGLPPSLVRERLDMLYPYNTSEMMWFDGAYQSGFIAEAHEGRVLSVPSVFNANQYMAFINAEVEIG